MLDKIVKESDSEQYSFFHLCCDPGGNPAGRKFIRLLWGGKRQPPPPGYEFEILQKKIAAAEKPEGEFISYLWRNPSIPQSLEIKNPPL